MAANNIREEKKSLAIEHQQCFYELLPECVRYRPDEHRYLKQNIGYAIFGPPVSSEEMYQVVDQKEKSNCYYKSRNVNNTDLDIVDIIDYDEQATKIIKKIYDRICECVYIKTNPQPIYVGTIYNVIFFPDEEEEKKKEKTQKLVVIPIPVFTIRLNSKQKFYIGKAANNICHADYTKIQPSNYETWYVDTNARVYTTWESYVTTNLLPECIMVLPKDGVYKANPDYPITEDYSTVWVEIMDSPARTPEAKGARQLDVICYCLSVASLFTPAALFTLPSLVIGAAGAWTMGRCVERLVDRNDHMECVDFFDEEAFPYWLGLAGPIASFGVNKGGNHLSKAAASGQIPSKLTKVTFNILRGGNLVLNGAGIAYMTRSLRSKYLDENTVSTLDALILATHVMFFANSVMNGKFADNIIRDTQNKVIQDYKNTLTNKRLRYKFNRVVKKVQNNPCEISQNADVIRYIKSREQLISDSDTTHAGSSTLNSNTSQKWTFNKNTLIIDDIKLLPFAKFVQCNIATKNVSHKNSATSNEYNFESKISNYQENDDDVYNVRNLVIVLSKLLNEFYEITKFISKVEASDLIPVLINMRFLNIDEDDLKKIFAIVKELVIRVQNTKKVMIEAFIFIWDYCKANLPQWNIHSIYRVQSDSGSKILKKIITGIYEAIKEVISSDLCEVFMSHLKYRKIDL